MIHTYALVAIAASVAIFAVAEAASPGEAGHHGLIAVIAGFRWPALVVGLLELSLVVAVSRPFRTATARPAMVSLAPQSPWN